MDCGIRPGAYIPAASVVRNPFKDFRIKNNGEKAHQHTAFQDYFTPGFPKMLWSSPANTLTYFPRCETSALILSA